MEKPLLVLLVHALFYVIATAQTPATDSVWIETNNLRMCLRSDGSLYSGAPGGAIQFRQETPGGDKWISVVKDGGLWLGGMDAGGNLMLSVQQFEPRITDFMPGISGLTGSDKIWHVKENEIQEHRHDYADNGVIDNPLQSIYSWPGYGSAFVNSHNGFVLPDTFFYKSGHYVDRNLNYIYEPDKGEYPLADYPRGASIEASELAFFYFRTDGPARLTHRQCPVQGWGYAFAFNCPETPVLENSIFLVYNWENTGTEQVYSANAGFYLNADLGNPTDDYQGCLPGASTYFTYNSDALDENGFEQNPPVLTLQTLRAPIDTFGNRAPMYCMPVGPQAGQDSFLLPGQTFPELPYEFYRYLNCSWRDGIPLTQAGTGYNWSNTEIPTCTAFPGNPYTPGVWSEVNSGNKPGDRRALITWPISSMRVGGINSLALMISVVTVVDTFSNNEVDFDAKLQQLAGPDIWFDCCISGPGLAPPPCMGYPNVPFPHYIVRAYPNPASDVLHIQVEGRKLRSIRLYDCFQRMIREINRPYDDYYYWENLIDLPVRDLPPGLYYLEATSWETIETVVQKVLVVH